MKGNAVRDTRFQMSLGEIEKIAEELKKGLFSNNYRRKRKGPKPL
jgi:hypothetical protein